MVHGSTEGTTRIPADELKHFIESTYDNFGAKPANADRLARSLVEADLRGHNSHGVQLVPHYEESIDEGIIDVTAVPTVEHRDSYSATIEDHSCIGRVLGAKATETAIDIAEESGIAVVTMCDGNHLGRIGEWAEMAADEGFLFTAFTKAYGSFVAPAGSADRRYSTNPITFGIPSFDACDFPIVLDIATSTVANGKTVEKAQADEPMPEGWAIKESGEPLTDAQAFQEGEGALLPLGGGVAGYKGFGLATIVELFGGILGDGQVAGQKDPVRSVNTAAFVVIDPLKFTTKSDIEARILAYEEHIKSADYTFSPGTVARGDSSLLPGEAEHYTAQERREQGIPLAERTIDALNETATGVGVEETLGQTKLRE